MDSKEMKSIIEGLLFAWGDPLTIKDISKILEIKESLARKLIKDLMDEFDFYRRGIRIIRINNSYQLTTRIEHKDYIAKLVTNDHKKTLSAAALETLSIVAYKQPITKNEIEKIRGVKCNSPLDTLLSKDLIKEVGRLDKIGRPIIYGTTDNFLKSFGLENLNQLPDIDGRLLEEI